MLKSDYLPRAAYKDLLAGWQGNGWSVQEFVFKHKDKDRICLLHVPAEISLKERDLIIFSFELYTNDWRTTEDGNDEQAMIYHWAVNLSQGVAHIGLQTGVYAPLPPDGDIANKIMDWLTTKLPLSAQVA